MAFKAVFELEYGAISTMKLFRSRDPKELETFTIRPAGADRNSGRNALVTVTTEKTFVSYTDRNVCAASSTGSWLMLVVLLASGPLAMPALLTCRALADLAV